MRKTLILIALTFIFNYLPGYTIGQYTKTFFDASRSRNIQTVFFYPIDEANPNEVYPYIVFGHGWLVNYTFTQTLTDNLVNLGWIVANPRTEEGIFPSHEQFALDLVYLRGAILTENSVSYSPIYSSVDTVSVVMGYSMGGGCAVVAASMDTGYNSVVTFAAAETDISAIAAAENVIVPSVTFSGSADNVAPPVSHQIPIYNNLASDYKCYVSINGAGHLNLCSNTLIPELLTPWLSFLKTNDIGFIDAFEDTLAGNSGSLTYQVENNLVVSNQDIIKPDIDTDIVVFPNPIRENATIRFPLNRSGYAEMHVFNVKGQLIKTLFKSTLTKGDHVYSWDCRNTNGERITPGLYIFSLNLNSAHISSNRILVIK